MKKFFIILFSTLFFSHVTNAAIITISCQNDYFGKSKSDDGWTDDKITIEKGEFFHVDTTLLPKATMTYNQHDNLGTETVLAIPLDNSIAFIATMADGISVHQYYFQYNTMFRSKINSILGSSPYGGLYYTKCTHKVKN